MPEHPRVFYKYTRAPIARLILETGRLRWSSPLLLNDLTEFRRMPRLEPSVADSLAPYVETLAEAALGHRALDEQRLSNGSKVLLALFRRAVATGATKADLMGCAYEASDADARLESALRAFFDEQSLRGARLLCVTTEPLNHAMWAHYADNHTGCLLAFTHIPELSTPLLAAKRVAYSEVPPVVGSGEEFLLYGTSRELQERTVDAVCFTKGMEWAYENEWRAVTWRHEESDQFGDYRFYPGELESVTFGPRIPQDDEAHIRRLLSTNYPHASVFRLVVERGAIAREAVSP